MKKFLINIGIFLILVSLTIIGIFLQADGRTDPFYKRFTTNRQGSLILGTSRAAQGILPEILNTELNRDDFFNYSFTLGHSPYGPTYLNSIKDKLDKKSNEGIFIITVDPWSISSKTLDPNDSLEFREVDRILGRISYVNYHPNFEYLINGFSSQYFDILKGGSDKMVLHENGWLEVTVEMDSIQVAKRIEDKINNYKSRNLPVYHFSHYRYKYLGETISYLKNYGKVYLIRLPISPEMYDIEKLLIPDFDYRMDRLSKTYEVPYFNLTYKNSDFQYTDGNHLYKESGRKVSSLISQMILESND